MLKRVAAAPPELTAARRRATCQTLVARNGHVRTMPVVERNADATRAWFAREVPCVGVAVDQRGADADRGGPRKTIKSKQMVGTYWLRRGVER